MAEPPLHRTHWQAGRPLRVGGLTLLPIERVLLHAQRGRHGGWVTASKEPAAIVVRDALRWHALAADGSPMDLDALRQRVPGLDALLDAA